MTQIDVMPRTELVSTAQAASMLGTYREAVLRAARRGDLPPVHKIDGLRGAYLFRRDDVAAYGRGERPLPPAPADAVADALEPEGFRRDDVHATYAELVGDATPHAAAVALVRDHLRAAYAEMDER